MHPQRRTRTLKPMTTTPERPRRRLTLSATDKKIAGVCDGLAEYFNTDATLVRLIFVVLILLGGLGVIIYLIAWIIMPHPYKVPSWAATGGAASVRVETTKHETTVWIRLPAATPDREPSPPALTDHAQSAGGELVSPADDTQATITVTLPTSAADAESGQGH